MKMVSVLMAMISFVTLSANAQEARSSEEIVSNLVANAKQMKLVYIDQQVIEKSAARTVVGLTSDAESKSVACLAAAPGIESCVWTGVMSIHAPDGGPKTSVTKVLLFNLVNGVASGNVMMVQ